MGKVVWQVVAGITLGVLLWCSAVGAIFALVFAHWIAAGVLGLLSALWLYLGTRLKEVS